MWALEAEGSNFIDLKKLVATLTISRQRYQGIFHVVSVIVTIDSFNELLLLVRQEKKETLWWKIWKMNVEKLRIGCGDVVCFSSWQKLRAWTSRKSALSVAINTRVFQGMVKSTTKRLVRCGTKKMRQTLDENIKDIICPKAKTQNIICWCNI